MAYKKHNADLEVIASAEGKSGLKLSKITTGALVQGDSATVLAHDNTSGEVVRFDLANAVNGSAGNLIDSKIADNNASLVTGASSTGKTIATVAGVEIKTPVTGLETPTLVGNNLTIKFRNENGVVEEKVIDLSGIVTTDINVQNLTIDGNNLRITETDNSEHTVDLSKFVVTTETNGQGVVTFKQGDNNSVATTLTPEAVARAITLALTNNRYVDTSAYTANVAKTHTHALVAGSNPIVQVFDAQGFEVYADVKIVNATTFTVTSTTSETLKVVAI